MTGEAPERDGAGALRLGPESAVVFVLLPGGSFEMGAQSRSPDRSNYDADAEPSESPVHRVELEPFFIAKHELTQAQWRRITGRSPARSRGAMLPVESVSWTESVEALRSIGFLLPTEEQWEYAARGGVTTPWWTGADPLTLVGAAHLALDSGRSSTPLPVGSLRGNAFGLHDILGNVAEWCSNAPGPYGGGALSPSKRVFRGGSFEDEPADARLADRYAGEIGDRFPTLGLRVVLRYEGES